MLIKTYPGFIGLFNNFIILMKGATAYEWSIGPFSGGIYHLEGLPLRGRFWRIRRDSTWRWNGSD